MNKKYRTYYPIILGLLYCLAIPAVVHADVKQAGCQALFDYETYSGPLPTLGGITFHNLSSGDFDGLSWDFGDNSFSSEQSSSLDHFYSESGIFTVCLDLWNGQDCADQYCQEITVDIDNQSCATTDCVFPGDANYDGQADLYDLMTIGVGLGENGPPRPNASINWIPQAAPDWPQFTPSGINYKHLDCDGNGNISTADMLAILTNYSAIKQPLISTAESDGPLVSLQFDTDTIFIDENTPDLITVTAGLMAGNSSYPMHDVYSLALYLDYDTTFVQADNGVLVEFAANSFVGNSTNGELLSHGINLRAEQQIDLGLTRTNGAEAGGFGRIATVKFIVVADIIDGRVEPTDPVTFDVPLSGVKVANSLGNERFVSWSKTPARIVFANKIPTSTHTPALSRKVKLYPNPAHDQLTIELDGLQPQRLSLFNLLGEPVLEQELEQRKANIALSDLESGLYLLEVSTAEGLVTKRVVVW